MSIVPHVVFSVLLVLAGGDSVSPNAECFIESDTSALQLEVRQGIGVSTNTPAPTTGFGGWTKKGSDIEGTAYKDTLGFSVSLNADGSRMAIGAPGGWWIRSDRVGGFVRVYEWTNGSWQQMGSDIEGTLRKDTFGKSVSLSADGTRVAIGAPGLGRVSSDPDTGYARVFEWTNGAWQQMGSDFDAESAHDMCGYSVSLSSSGTRVAIGAPHNDAAGDNAGHVRIFEWTSGSWQQMGSDIDGEGRYDESGYSISLSSDGARVAIGAPGNRIDTDGVPYGVKYYAGHTRIFEWTGGSWQQMGSDINGEEAYQYCGWSVALSADGTRVVSGAKQYWSHLHEGITRVYQLTNGSWQQMGSDILGDSAGDRSGWAVSMSGDGTRIVTGAPHARDMDCYTRIYDWISGNWTSNGLHFPGDGDCGLAVSLSRDGTHLANGDPHVSVSGLPGYGGAAAGHVRVYKSPPVPSPAPGPAPGVKAYGDPHLQNIHGQHFDLMQPGSHTLVQIPRHATEKTTLFHVQAEVQRIGAACADMYIQALNVTGEWANNHRQGGLHFSVHTDMHHGRKGTNWMHFGSHKNYQVDMKVVYGRMAVGTTYLNFFVRHLEEIALHVGGLLGEDDHTAAATPAAKCRKVMSL